MTPSGHCPHIASHRGSWHFIRSDLAVNLVSPEWGVGELIDFEYAAPTSLDEVLGRLNEHGSETKLLAGGTDILVQLREGQRAAKYVVDIKKIPELMQLSYSPSEGMTLGAGVPCSEIYDHAEIAAAYPALIDAARILGGWQIQTRASIGGNLCNASPAADSAAPVIAYNATCEIAGPGGRRSVPALEFFQSPGKNVMQSNELLVAIHFPAQPARSSAAYRRLIPRNEMDIAVAGVAAWVQLEESGETIASARIGACAVAATPQYAAEASQWLAGKPATEETFEQAGELAKQVAKPIDDMRGTAEYRTHLVGVLTKRMLAQAVQRATQ